MDLSSNAVQLTPSLTLAIDSKAKAMRAEGIDVCGFGRHLYNHTIKHIKMKRS